MSTTPRPLTGVLPVISTPFTATEEIDSTTLAAEIDWLFEQGVDGVVTAMVSEFLRLDPAERQSLAEDVVAAVGGRGTVVLSAGAESTRQSLRLAEHAAGCGVDGIMVNPPLTTTPDGPALREHFRSLARATGDVPVIVQDASGYVGRPLPLDLLQGLLDDFGDVKVQFKPEAEPLGPRLTALLEATGGRAKVYEGSGGRVLLESHRRGVTGTMPGADIPWAIVALWRALEAGDDETAYRWQERITPILNLISSLDSYIAVEKHLLHRQGVFGSTVQRGPVDFVMDEVTRAEVDRLFDRLVALRDANATPSGAGAGAGRGEG